MLILSNIVVDSKPAKSHQVSRVHIKRPCLVVADLKRALSIYQDILGFKLDYLAEAGADSYLYSVFGFNQQAKLTFASLNSEDEPRAIALTEVQGITLPPPPQPQRLGLVVRVENLAETITALSKLGLKIIQANKFTVEPNLIFTEQAFEDYDGHLIILYQVRTR